MTIDGEDVVCGPNGVSDFDRLRAAVGRMGARDAFLYAFDLLELDGNDLRREPWDVRRATLTSVLRKAANGIRLSEHLASTDGEAIFQMPAPWGSKVSSPSAAIGRIDQGDRRTGLRSRTRMHRPQAG